MSLYLYDQAWAVVNSLLNLMACNSPYIGSCIQDSVINSWNGLVAQFRHTHMEQLEKKVEISTENGTKQNKNLKIQKCKKYIVVSENNTAQHQ